MEVVKGFWEKDCCRDGCGVAIEVERDVEQSEGREKDEEIEKSDLGEEVKNSNSKSNF